MEHGPARHGGGQCGREELYRGRGASQSLSGSQHSEVPALNSFPIFAEGAKAELAPGEVRKMGQDDGDDVL